MFSTKSQTARHATRIDIQTASDLRRRIPRDLADLLVLRAEHLLPEDRALIAAVYQDNLSAIHVARLLGSSPRAVRRRIRALVQRLLSPRYEFVARRRDAWGPTPRPAARARLAPAPAHVLPDQRAAPGRPPRAQTPPQEPSPSPPRRAPHRPGEPRVKTDDPIAALAHLFAPDDAAARERLAAIAAALDDPAAAPLLSAGCRAVALRSLIAAASQTNNAEAARRAAMTLLERFDPEPIASLLDDPAAIERTRALLEKAAADLDREDQPSENDRR